jgi:hypothetical protein
MSYDFLQKSNLLTEAEKAQFLGENAELFYSFRNLSKIEAVLSMVE